MNAHEKQTTTRQRAAALALNLVGGSMAVRSQMAAYGAGDAGAGGSIDRPPVDPEADDGNGDFETGTRYWIVGDPIGLYPSE